MNHKIKIAIIDDEPEFIEIIEKYINKIIQDRKNQDSISLEKFISAEDFLKAMDHGEDYQIIFSDIEMEQMSGIQLGRKLTDEKKDIYLIFLTSHAEFAAESYLLNTYQYILKSDMKRRIPEILNSVLEKLENREKKYRVIPSGDGIKKILYRDIVCIQKIKGKKYLEYCKCDGDTYREQINLQQLFEELQAPEFLVLDRSCIVNIEHIEQITGNILVMDSGQRLTISKRHLTEIKHQIREYWEGL